MGIGGIVAYKRWTAKRKGADPSILRTRNARKVAQERLSQAERSLKEVNSRAFYDEVSKAMLGYISDKLHLPPSMLSKDKLRERLEEPGIDAGLVNQFLEILSTCELALFAGKENTAAMKDVFVKSIETISQMERQL